MTMKTMTMATKMTKMMTKTSGVEVEGETCVQDRTIHEFSVKEGKNISYIRGFRLS